MLIRGPMRTIVFFILTVLVASVGGVLVSAIANFLYQDQLAVGPVLPTAFAIIGAAYFVVLWLRSRPGRSEMTEASRRDDQADP